MGSSVRRGSNYWSSSVDRCSNNRSRLIDGGSFNQGRLVAISLCRFWGVDRGTFIGNFSNISIDRVSSVGGGLDTAIRKSNCERSSNISGSILSFFLLEVGVGVVITYSILVSLGLGRGLRLN